MLLDSLEAVDADCIDGLIDHFSEYTEYMLIDLLSEAAALDEDYQRITDI